MMSLVGRGLLLAFCVGLCLGYTIAEDDYVDREERESVGIPPPNPRGQCLCDNSYIPFCGTDGVTYSNKCQLQCAQRSRNGLGVKFEGVCAKPYVPSGGSANGDQRIVGYGGRGINPIYGSSGSQRIVGYGGRGQDPKYISIHGNGDNLNRPGSGGRGLAPKYNGGDDLNRPGSGGRGLAPKYNGGEDLNRPGSGGRGLAPKYNGGDDLNRPGSGGRGLDPKYGKWWDQ